jgi:hypothetical protein
LSHDVEDLHDEVCQLLEEFDSIAYRLLDKNTLVAFEKHVMDTTALNKSMQTLSMSSGSVYNPTSVSTSQYYSQSMDIDEPM